MFTAPSSIDFQSPWVLSADAAHVLRQQFSEQFSAADSSFASAVLPHEIGILKQLGEDESKEIIC